jgi:HEAT repeat protein
MIKHKNDNVAVGAIEALGRIGGKAAIEALIESTESGNFFRTFPAIDVLGRSGDPRVVEPLSKLLNNPNYLTEAARALGRSSEKSALKPLLTLLQSSSDSIIRVAATSISELRDRFEEKTVGEIESFDEQLRTQISEDVVRRLARMLSEISLNESIAITKLLGLIGNAEAVPKLTAQLDSRQELADSAADALKNIGNSADAHLREAIRSGNSLRRKVILPLITRSAAAEDVVLCLSDEDSNVRVLACETLSRLGVATVVPNIFNLLHDTNLRVVHAATAAIQALGSREARTLAVEASKSSSASVRRSAIHILSYFGDISATQPLLDGLNDSDTRVKEAAIQGLPFLEDSSAQEVLFDIARDKDPRTKSLAMRAIGQLPKASDRAFSILLKGISDQDAWVRYYACQSLGRLKFEIAASDIAQLLFDEAGQVRVSAVEALSNLNSTEAHTALKSAVKSTDADVKRAALVGLGIARRMEDLKIILSEVNSKDAPTRLIALSALVGFPSPKVFGALRSAGSDPDEQVRVASIGFLSARAEQEATEMLIELLQNENTFEKAKTALLIPSAGRVSGILVALESANDQLATVLVSLLRKVEQNTSSLLIAMNLNNVAARKAAATAVAAYKNMPDMMEALKIASENDPDREVRQICKLLLNE